jgi:hypothetical protein
MARLNTADAFHQKEIADIRFFDLALHTRWPNFVGAYQAV